jgi:cytoplasmic iron level regulating protein YaaA (DUF328/UPF0246 family)
VLVLLPPSEGKTPPRRGAPVDLAKLSFPELTEQRSHLLDVLHGLAHGPREHALAALGLSPGQAGEADLGATLRTAPAAAAAKVYTGVLYERLRLPELPAPARRRVLIASGLWGFVRPGDRIPAYRLSISARLPGLPGLAAYWRPALEAAVPASGLVLDMRSGGYAAAFKPREANLLAVRGFTPDGKVISHFVKALRGDVARIALLASPVPRTPRAVAELVAAAGYDVRLNGGNLDVVVG